MKTEQVNNACWDSFETLKIIKFTVRHFFVLKYLPPGLFTDTDDLINVSCLCNLFQLVFESCLRKLNICINILRTFPRFVDTIFKTNFEHRHHLKCFMCLDLPFRVSCRCSCPVPTNPVIRP